MKLMTIVAAAMIALILVAVFVWLIRIILFRPTRDKALQQKRLNDDLEPAGFAYERWGDYFYSLMDCWQRKTGYCKLYDENAHLFNMIMDCEPVTFFYGGKKWLIELWKGQYGITTGAEIGIYNTAEEDIDTEGFRGTFYEAVSNDERLPMSFVLYKNRRALIRRRELHWWLTGFKLGEFSEPEALTMEAKIKFPNREMCMAFVGGLQDIGYKKHEFSLRYNTVKIHYKRPHTTQPLADRPLQKAMVQKVNENNCRLYGLATLPYRDTMDKLEYLKAGAPELYEIFLKSLYAKGLYDMFQWLLDLIHKKPKPPCPECPLCPVCPPCPECPLCPVCPPCPECPPCPPKPPCPPDPPCPPKPCTKPVCAPKPPRKEEEA